MRCLSCNCQLDDYEATRKFAESGTFVDLCNNCFSHISDDVDVIDGSPPDSFSGDVEYDGNQEDYVQGL